MLMSQEEIEDRALGQMMVIERTYDVKIANRQEVARMISRAVENPRQVLLICTSLNSWVAMNGLRGEITIPSSLLERLLAHYGRPKG
jgi:hypothetical protein